MNYWKQTTDNLLKILEEKELVIDEEDKGNRKLIINLIKMDDLEKGKNKEVHILDDEGNLVTMESNMEATVDTKSDVEDETESEEYLNDPDISEVARKNKQRAHKIKRKDPNDLTRQKYDPAKPYGGIKMMKGIFRHSRDGEPNYVQLGVNGRQFYIPKDKEVVIPVYLQSAINDAIETRCESVTLEGGKIQQKRTDVPRISWQFMEFIN